MSGREHAPDKAPSTQISPPHRRTRPPAVEAIAGWSARHRKTAVFGWLALVAVAYLIGQLLGTPSLPQNDLGQAGQAERTLEHLGVSAPPVEEVLIQARTPGATFASDPALRQAVSQVAAALSRLPGAAAGIRTPLSPGGQALVSANGRSALVTFTVPGPPADDTTAVGPALSAVAAVQAGHPALLVAEAGDASMPAGGQQPAQQRLRQGQETSLPLTLVLLAVVFGALAAAGIPVLLAITSALTAIWLLAIPGHWLPVGSDTTVVVLLIGMAVGVDYSLFYLRREREERARGVPQSEAITTAARTSGRAIVVSGLTVMIALAGLTLTGYSLFTGIAIGTILVVGIAVTGSLTVLPALLSWLGDRVDKGRIPFIGRRRAAAQSSRLWADLVRRVVRRPLVWGGAAVITMLVIAAPLLGIRLAYPADDVPAGLPVVSTVNSIQAAFPQSPEPAQVVVTGRDLAGPAVTGAITELSKLAAAGGPLRSPVTVSSVADGRALIVSVPLAGNGGDTASYSALQQLRSQILPPTLGRAGVSYAVTGDTAIGHDDASQLSARTPLVLAVVAVLAFCLLLVAFRSIVLPLVSIAVNLLSIGAAYGVVTFIFQAGRLQGLLGYTGFGAITPWVPLFLFVFLFGLSMDYHVFILSRIRERRQHGDSTADAITAGISTSAGVVTSAAVIMVTVFSLFVVMGQVELKMLGIGLPVADPAGRHPRPRHPRAGRHDPARRSMLVPASLAVLAARPGSPELTGGVTTRPFGIIRPERPRPFRRRRGCLAAARWILVSALTRCARSSPVSEAASACSSSRRSRSTGRRRARPASVSHRRTRRLSRSSARRTSCAFARRWTRPGPFPPRTRRWPGWPPPAVCGSASTSTWLPAAASRRQPGRSRPTCGN